MLHLGHQSGQRDLRGRRGDDQQVFPGQVAQQRDDIHPGPEAQDQPEHTHDEDRTSDVEGQHELTQAQQCRPAGFADHGGDGAECADGSEPHDHRQDPEHQALEVLDGTQNRLTRLAQALHGEADQQRHEQGLQHDRPGQRGDERGRDDAEQEVGRGSCLPAGRRLRRTRGLGGGAEMQARARLKQVADDQPDDQGDSRHDDEVEQRQAADLTDLRRLPDRPDTEHDRAEDHRTDHHLDQVDERGAQRLERLADVGGQETDSNARDHRDDHRHIEVMRAIFLLGGSLGGG